MLKFDEIMSARFKYQILKERLDSGEIINPSIQKTIIENYSTVYIMAIADIISDLLDKQDTPFKQYKNILSFCIMEDQLPENYIDSWNLINKINFSNDYVERKLKNILECELTNFELLKIERKIQNMTMTVVVDNDIKDTITIKDAKQIIITMRIKFENMRF